MRRCALLAYYVHGLELDYLPSPHRATPSADHVYHDPSLWSAYAVAVLAAGRPRQPTSTRSYPFPSQVHRAVTQIVISIAKRSIRKNKNKNILRS
jgi:hypothetical protein